MTQTPAHGETFKVGDSITVTALHTPCHTQDSICWYMQDGDEKVVFTGDTLFIGGKRLGMLNDRMKTCTCGLLLTRMSAGCGRFFEGTAEEMHKALNETLAALPDDTRVYVSTDW